LAQSHGLRFILPDLGCSDFRLLDHPADGLDGTRIKSVGHDHRDGAVLPACHHGLVLLVLCNLPGLLYAARRDLGCRG